MLPGFLKTGPLEIRHYGLYSNILQFKKAPGVEAGTIGSSEYNNVFIENIFKLMGKYGETHHAHKLSLTLIGTTIGRH